MNQPIILITIIILVVLIIGIFFISSQRNIPDKKVEMNTIKISIGGIPYTTEVADTPQLRRQGLMRRESLPENGGMLFVYDRSGRYSFWMKNTLIPLDIIWVAEDKEIVHIKENAQPCESIAKAICQSAFPRANARYVIELNAGEVQKRGFTKGDIVEFDID